MIPVLSIYGFSVNNKLSNTLSLKSINTASGIILSADDITWHEHFGRLIRLVGLDNELIERAERVRCKGLDNFGDGDNDGDSGGVLKVVSVLKDNDFLFHTLDNRLWYFGFLTWLLNEKNLSMPISCNTLSCSIVFSLVSFVPGASPINIKSLISQLDRLMGPWNNSIVSSCVNASTDNA